MPDSDTSRPSSPLDQQAALDQWLAASPPSEPTARVVSQDRYTPDGEPFDSVVQTAHGPLTLNWGPGLSYYTITTDLNGSGALDTITIDATGAMQVSDDRGATVVLKDSPIGAALLDSLEAAEFDDSNRLNIDQAALHRIDAGVQAAKQTYADVLERREPHVEAIQNLVQEYAEIRDAQLAPNEWYTYQEGPEREAYRAARDGTIATAVADYTEKLHALVDPETGMIAIVEPMTLTRTVNGVAHTQVIEPGAYSPVQLSIGVASVAEQGVDAKSYDPTATYDVFRLNNLVGKSYDQAYGDFMGKDGKSVDFDAKGFEANHPLLAQNPVAGPEPTVVPPHGEEDALLVKTGNALAVDDAAKAPAPKHDAPLHLADGPLAKNYGVPADAMPEVKATLVEAYQQLLVNGYGSEGMRTSRSDDGVDGMWGPKTQKYFEQACKDAGVDPEKVDLNNPNDPETKRLVEGLQVKAKARGVAVDGAGHDRQEPAPAPAAENGQDGVDMRRAQTIAQTAVSGMLAGMAFPDAVSAAAPPPSATEKALEQIVTIAASVPEPAAQQAYQPLVDGFDSGLGGVGAAMRAAKGAAIV